MAISCTTTCWRAARSTWSIESDVNILDIAALTVIVEEAGGKFTDLEGAPVGLETTTVLATNGPLHDTILETRALRRLSMSVFLRWGIFGILGVAALVYAYNASKSMAEKRAARDAAAATATAQAEPSRRRSRD